MSRRSYVPVLHELREGLSAIEALFAVSPERREGLSPLLPIVGEPSGDLPELISSALSRSRFYVDGPQSLLRALRERFLAAIPVVRPDEPDERLRALAVGPALLVRTPLEPDEQTLRALAALPERAGLPLVSVELLVELGDVSHGFPAALRDRLRAALPRLPLVREAGAVVISASSVPLPLELEADHELPRVEWLAFREAALDPEVPRALDFSDHAGLSALPALTPELRPHLRWAVGDGVRVVSARHGADAMPVEDRHSIARRLVDHPSFPGFLHCPGCHLAAEGARHPGTLVDRAHLRRVELMHHVAHLTEQVARLGTPAARASSSVTPG